MKWVHANIIAFYTTSASDCEFLLKKKILIAQVYIVYFVTSTIPLVYPTLLLGIKLSNTSKHLPKIIFKNIICNLFVKDLISLRKPACFFVGFFAFVSYLISFWMLKKSRNNIWFCFCYPKNDIYLYS